MVFAYWLIFLFNDPLNFRNFVPSYVHIPTLDARVIDSSDSCIAFNIAAFQNNALYFLLWWGTHSGLARTKVKKALGIDEHPIERPLFAAIATVVWFINVYTWQPISNCSKFDVLRVPSLQWLVSGPILLFSTFLIVGILPPYFLTNKYKTFNKVHPPLFSGLLWALPDHVFGTSKYKYKQHKFPEQKLIKDTFPYGLVRHPAAAGFLFWYIFLPAYTTNHLVLSAFWLSFM